MSDKYINTCNNHCLKKNQTKPKQKFEEQTKNHKK